MEYSITHNIPEQKFEAYSDYKLIGLIDYLYSDNNKAMIVTHTEVNHEYEGKGIAGAMTKVLIEYAIQNQLKIIPSCSYTRMYLNRHSEYKDLIHT